MSATYATAIGMRSPVTTRGGKDGVRVAAQAYDGSVSVSNWYNEDKLMINIEFSDHSSTYGSCSMPSIRGTFEEVVAQIQLLEDIKSGKVSVVRHRQPKEVK